MLVISANKKDPILNKIDRVLTEIFGKEATRIIYQYLETRYSLKPNDFADKIDIFAKGLEDCLSTGALPVEARIFNMKDLFE